MKSFALNHLGCRGVGYNYQFQANQFNPNQRIWPSGYGVRFKLRLHLKWLVQHEIPDSLTGARVRFALSAISFFGFILPTMVRRYLVDLVQSHTHRRSFFDHVSGSRNGHNKCSRNVCLLAVWVDCDGFWAGKCYYPKYPVVAREICLRCGFVRP
jgi:hypothetical protein